MVEQSYEDYEYYNAHSYVLNLPYSNITISGEYIKIHPISADDKVYTGYYIVNSEYNSIIGNSKISEFLDELIDKYAE